MSAKVIESQVEFTRIIGSYEGEVTIRLSPMWVNHAIARGIDVGTVLQENDRDVTLSTTYKQRRNIVMCALEDSEPTEETDEYKKRESRRRAAIRVVRKLRLKLAE